MNHIHEFCSFPSRPGSFQDFLLGLLSLFFPLLPFSLACLPVSPSVRSCLTAFEPPHSVGLCFLFWLYLHYWVRSQIGVPAPHLCLLTENYISHFLQNGSPGLRGRRSCVNSRAATKRSHHRSQWQSGRQGPVPTALGQATGGPGRAQQLFCREARLCSGGTRPLAMGTFPQRSTGRDTRCLRRLFPSGAPSSPSRVKELSFLRRESLLTDTPRTSTPVKL